MTRQEVEEIRTAYRNDNKADIIRASINAGIPPRFYTPYELFEGDFDEFISGQIESITDCTDCPHADYCETSPGEECRLYNWEDIYPVIHELAEKIWTHSGKKVTRKTDLAG